MAARRIVEQARTLQNHTIQYLTAISSGSGGGERSLLSDDDVVVTHVTLRGSSRVFFCMESNGTIGSTWKQSEQREIPKWAVLLLVLAVVAILLLVFAEVLLGGLMVSSLFTSK